MDWARRQALVEQYTAGPRLVAEALAGIAEAELEARPGAGEWSVREIVHHLADAEMTGALRLRQLLVEDEPTIRAYDEAEYARRLHYDRPIEASLEAFRAARRTTAEILERLSEAEWARRGRHPERGEFGVETWLEVYAEHAQLHADQIRRARGAG